MAKRGAGSRATSRRRFLTGAAAGLGALLWSGLGTSDTPSAPVSIQAELLARILPYERGFAKRGRGDVAIVVVRRSGNADSASAAGHVRKELLNIGRVGGRPVRVEMTDYSTAQALGERCLALNAHALYVTPGFQADIAPISRALLGSGVLSMAAMEADVAAGVVLGVEIVNGKPKMSINLRQLRAQKLDLPASVLKLGRIYK